MAHQRSVSSERLSARGVEVAPELTFSSPRELATNLEEERLFKQIMRSQKSFRNFLKYPLDGYPKVVFQCTITREWLPGSSRNSEPIFRMYLENNNKKLFLLSAREDKAGIAYRITWDTENTQTNEFAAGELRFSCFGSNFLCDTFRQEGADTFISREEVLGVHYKTNVFGMRGPRQMVIVLSANYDLKSNKIVPTLFTAANVKDTLLSRYHTHGCTMNSENIVVCRNAKPTWNDAYRAYQLQFSERIRCSSVKNFKVPHPTEENQDLIQFGKSSYGVFSLNFSYPLCPIQAFALALSSIHPKMACD